MRRRSDKNKTKPTPKEESPEKNSSRKSHRHSRRRRKSSSSSDDESKSPKKEISQPIEVQVQDIELPQGGESVPSVTNDKKEEIPKKPGEKPEDWKEDSTFWEGETQKPAEETSAEGGAKEKGENSMWKVQSSNGAGDGCEIQKLKICRQRPTESPELVDVSLRKRLSRGPRDSRSTDDSAHEESEKDTKKAKHRSNRNSPLVSPTVICDMSEGSPTKIKIINVSHLNTDNKGGIISSKTVNDETANEKADVLKPNPPTQEEDSQISDTLDIALPADEPPQIALPTDEPPKEKSLELKKDNAVEKKIEDSYNIPFLTNDTPEEISEPSQVEDKSQSSPKRPAPLSPRPENATAKSNSSGTTSSESDTSDDKTKVHRVKKKRRRGLQSTVQQKLSTSASPRHESSDSEEGQKKKEADGRGATDTRTGTELAVNDKENEADNSIAPKDQNNVEENHEKEEQTGPPMPRKRRWGSSKSNRPSKKTILNISTASLKNLIPDAKLVPADELQLSVEEEEGQLDDDEEEDEVVALVAKEEEKQLEKERQREERHKEREKELEDRKKRMERFEKSKPSTSAEKPPPTNSSSDKGASSRKILLLTDDAKKLARSPSPPRHKPTSVLFITHLVRPFTVQLLKNLLLRTGTIAENGFWIDKIKSKCYVEYTTEDAAVETRHALHGVRWPTSNPKTLVVEFASHDDLVVAQTLSEEPDVPRKAEPLNMVEGWVAEQARIKERTRRAVVREWDVGKPEHPDEVLEHDLKMKEKREQERKARKERHHRSSTPDAEPPARKPRRKEEDAPAKLLDDLFRKTKTSPCIYWLPLTQEQIAVKEEIRRQHMAEHERRMTELKKAELARRDRERRNRK